MALAGPFSWPAENLMCGGSRLSRCGRSRNTAARLACQDRVVRRSITLLVALAVSLVMTGCSQALGSAAAAAPSPAPPTTMSTAPPTAMPPALPATSSAAAGTPCVHVYNAVRCQTMTDYVAIELGATREQIASLDVIPQPTPDLNIYSGGPPVDVSVTLRDGSVHVLNLNCGGISGVQCADDPHLVASSVMHGGYYDGTEAQLLGARPSIAPDALADAMPLRIDRLDIPVDHAGQYEVSIGLARLPNGILTAADFALVQPWPTGISILDGNVLLDIRSLDDGGKPIRNIYEHGWHRGSERVEAVLVFNVAHVDPGATLGIKDVVVQ